MKFRVLFLFLVSLALVSCNFSLAEDVTPPPDYVSPTPLPDIGMLVPAQPPSPGRGEELFPENCAPCHGEEGLGNGPMAGSMPVAVPAIGLRDISSQKAPADWYKTISLGNLERGMPPFIAHPSQERWDILAYTYMLSTTPDELQRGADLFGANCAECHAPGGSASAEVDFTDQQFMSQATGTSLYRAIAEGKGPMQAFGGQLSEDDIWALTAYLRSLSFDMAAQATPTPEPTLTSIPTQTGTLAGTPSTELLATPSTQVVETPAPAVLQIDGTVTNASGSPLETGLLATLSLYDTTTSQVVESLSSQVSADGSFQFNDVAANMQVAYWVSVDYQGVTYFSTAGTYDGSVSAMSFSLPVYDTSDDWTMLALDLLHVVLDFSTPGVVGVNELYSITNNSTLTIIVETDGSSLPFINIPDGVTDLSLQPGSNSAPFLPAPNGFAMPPVEAGQYGVVASFSMPYERRLEFSQNLSLPAASVTLFVVEGAGIKSDQLTDGGEQTFNNTVYHLYQATDLPAGPLSFTATAPEGSVTSAETGDRTWLIIGVGALGVVFIGLGIFLFLRERARARQEEDEEDETGEMDDPLGDDPDAITDAIISLDEQFRNGEISREVHEKRRSELKENLKKAFKDPANAE